MSKMQAIQEQLNDLSSSISDMRARQHYNSNFNSSVAPKRSHVKSNNFKSNAQQERQEKTNVKRELRQEEERRMLLERARLFCTAAEEIPDFSNLFAVTKEDSSMSAETSTVMDIKNPELPVKMPFQSRPSSNNAEDNIKSIWHALKNVKVSAFKGSSLIFTSEDIRSYLPRNRASLLLNGIQYDVNKGGEHTSSTVALLKDYAEESSMQIECCILKAHKNPRISKRKSKAEKKKSNCAPKKLQTKSEQIISSSQNSNSNQAQERAQARVVLKQQEHREQEVKARKIREKERLINEQKHPQEMDLQDKRQEAQARVREHERYLCGIRKKQFKLKECQRLKRDAENAKKVQEFALLTKTRLISKSRSKKTDKPPSNQESTKRSAKDLKVQLERDRRLRRETKERIIRNQNFYRDALITEKKNLEKLLKSSGRKRVPIRAQTSHGDRRMPEPERPATSKDSSHKHAFGNVEPMYCVMSSTENSDSNSVLPPLVAPVENNNGDFNDPETQVTDLPKIGSSPKCAIEFDEPKYIQYSENPALIPSPPSTKERLKQKPVWKRDPIPILPISSFLGQGLST